MLWRMLALILLWFVSFGQAQARSVYVLDSMACCRYDIAYMGALNTLKASGITVEHRILDLDHSQVLHDVVHKHPDAWMAIGTEATHFLATHIHNAPVIYSMVMNPSKKILAADNMRGIVLNPDADAMLQLLDDFNISAQHIGVLTGTTNHTDFSLQRFKHAAERREWLLDVWHVPNVTLLASHLDDFLQHHDALILFADRDVLTARTFRMIVQHCRKARVPLLAPSKLLVRFGALASFDVSPQDVGQQAAMLLIQWLNGQLDTTEHTWSVAHRVPVINRTTMKWNRLRMPRFIKKGAVFYD